MFETQFGLARLTPFIPAQGMKSAYALPVLVKIAGWHNRGDIAVDGDRFASKVQSDGDGGLEKLVGSNYLSLSR